MQDSWVGMQESWVGIALMAGVVLLGLLICIIFSRGRAQRIASIFAFISLALLLAIFYVVVIDNSQQWLVPVFTILCVLVPIIVYAILASLGNKRDSSSASGMSIPVGTNNYAVETGNGSAGSPSVIGKAASYGADQDSSMAGRRQKASVASYDGPSTSTPTLQEEEKTSATNEEIVIPRGTPHSGMPPVQQTIFDDQDISTQETEVIVPIDIAAIANMPTPDLSQQKTEEMILDIFKDKPEPVVDEPEDSVVEIDERFAIPLPLDFTPEPAQEASASTDLEGDTSRTEASAESDGGIDPTSDATDAAQESMVAASDAPAEQVSAEATEEAPDASLAFDTCYAKAESFKEKGVYAVAARLYFECAQLEAEKAQTKKALFESMASYVKAGMFDDAKRIALILRDDLDSMNPLEIVKLDAVLRTA